MLHRCANSRWVVSALQRNGVPQARRRNGMGARLFASSVVPQLEEMPVAKRAFELQSDVKLDSSVLLVASQHVLETTWGMMNGYLQCGLPPENISVIGKCYSTRPETYQRFLNSDMYVSPYSVAFDSHRAFDHAFGTFMARFIQERLVQRVAEDDSIRSVLLMDDGGYLLSSVNTMLRTGSMDVIKERGVHVFGVEQTSSGWQRLRDVDLSFPVMNVARSRAKLEHESPLIAKFTLPRIKYHIENVQVQTGRGWSEWPRNALVIGGGAIGMSAAISIKDQGIPVTVLDLERGVLDIPLQTNSGCEVNAWQALERCPQEHLRQLLAVSDLIVGSTGGTSVTPADFEYLRDGTLLCSNSSSDREFSGVDLRRHAPRSNEWNQCFQCKLSSEKTVHLAFSGFPLTFDAHCRYAGDPQHMQLTISLLIHSALEAAKRMKGGDVGRVGLVDVDDAVQQELIDLFHALDVPGIVERDYGALPGASI